MAQSPPPPPPPPPLPPQSLLGMDHWVFSQSWGWANHSDSTSPASSSDSSGSCPCDGTSQPQPPPPAPARRARAAEAAPPAPRRARPAPGGGQRQSASEREKLRMRTLARALHELRRFLPPSVAPAGQSLTKIETLRLAIRYIGHLSAVLGLSEDSLQRRRRRRVDTGSPRGCPLCPDGNGGGGGGGGGPAQAQTFNPGLASAAAYSGASSWEASHTCARPQVSPEHLESRVSDVDPWVTPPYYPQMQSPVHQSLGRALNMSLWTPSHGCPGTQTAPESGNKPGRWTSPPVSSELAELYQSISMSAESCLSTGNPALLSHSSCQRLQPQPQWGCWGHSAEVLPSSEDQNPCPTFQLPAASTTPSSGLRLSGCPELWQEDLEGPPLNIFY